MRGATARIPYYRDYKRLHDSVVIKVARWLRENEHRDHTLSINPQLKRQKYLVLRDGRYYYPDIMDETCALAYEVSWKGERKEESFDLLPEGWNGIDVFITDHATPYSIIVRMPGFEILTVWPGLE